MNDSLTPSLANLFRHAHEGILLCDAQVIIEDVNDAVLVITGYHRDEVIGKNPSIFKSGLQGAEFYRSMWADLELNGHWDGEVWNRRKDGTLYAARLTISVLRDAAGEIDCYVGSFLDVTATRSRQDRIRFMAQFDPLTHLPSRALLVERLEHALDEAIASHTMLAVCCFDLDGLKGINQLFGFSAGDEVLTSVTTRLNELLAMSHTLARIGGGEFAVLLVELASVDECTRLAQGILDAIATPINIRNGDVVVPVTVTATMGVTVFPNDGADCQRLLRHADQAMYTAKAKNCNCFSLFDPTLDQQSRAQREIVERVRKGIAAGEFRLYYQPKIDMHAGTILGFEALVRWQHPTAGLRLPATFLPAIEKTGADLEMGRWVLSEAVRQSAVWHDCHLFFNLSINISATQLLAHGFVDDLVALLQQYPTVDPARLEIEIVESTALDDIEAAITVFERCRALGLRIALDDFGTGYSSLSYFRRFPVDVIKLDQMFVRRMHDDAGDLAIVKSVLGLASAFRRMVVAEGIETLDQAQLLRSMGCDIGQGFGIARPMPVEDVAAWVKSYDPLTFWSDSPWL